MIRTQVYLTDIERKQLHLLAHAGGKSQSEIIREAIDQFIANHLGKKNNKLVALRAAKGMWSNRKDLPSLNKLRSEFDRNDENGGK